MRYRTRKKLLAFAIYITDGFAGFILSISREGFLDLDERDLSILKELHEAVRTAVARLRVRLKARI